MTANSETLIAELIEQTRGTLNQAEQLRQLSNELLNRKENEASWSVLECVEHLARYGDYYMPELDNRIAASKKASNPSFKSGVLGNYFVNLMLPKEKPKKMKTMKEMNPLGSQLDVAVIDRFIEQQHKTLALLDQARKVDLTRTKTSVSISKLIKLRLGDTLRFLVAHNQRHMMQAERTVQA